MTSGSGQSAYNIR